MPEIHTAPHTTSRGKDINSSLNDTNKFNKYSTLTLIWIDSVLDFSLAEDTLNDCTV